MNSEKSHRQKSKRHFVGCVELIASQPFCIEFIDSHQSWGFPTAHLTDFVLEPNPEHLKTSPPEQLVLHFRRLKVVLKGWRLELLLGSLIHGRVGRIHAEKHLGALILEEAWVSEIQVMPLDGEPEIPAAKKEI